MDGELILSQESTTQGEPEGNLMYGIAMLPVIKRFRDLVKQFWYADDSAASGKLEQLKSWWEALKELGPEYGYSPNASKTKLIVKLEFLDFAEWYNNFNRGTQIFGSKNSLNNMFSKRQMDC